MKEVMALLAATDEPMILCLADRAESAAVPVLDEVTHRGVAHDHGVV